MAIAKVASYHDMPIEQAFGYAQAIKVGDTLYLSGQVSIDPDDQTNIIGAGDMAMQIRQVYANIQKVLANYQASLDHIVDEIVFVTDMDAFGAVANQCRHEIFAGAAVLASTVVQVQRLWLSELMIEVRCVAKINSESVSSFGQIADPARKAEVLT